MTWILLLPGLEVYAVSKIAPRLSAMDGAPLLLSVDALVLLLRPPPPSLFEEGPATAAVSCPASLLPLGEVGFRVNVPFLGLFFGSPN